MTATVVQLTMPGMTISPKRTATPRQYREDFLRRVISARTVAGMSREDVIAGLERGTGLKIKLQTYKKWETRTLLPHHLIIPFCEVTGADPYMILTGTPFSLGRSRPPMIQTQHHRAA